MKKFSPFEMSAPVHQELRAAFCKGPVVACFQRWYNHQGYHESIGNLRPVDVYEGRSEEILSRRKESGRQTLRARREHNLGASRQRDRAGQTGSEVHLTSRPAMAERL